MPPIKRTLQLFGARRLRDLRLDRRRARCPRREAPPRGQARRPPTARRRVADRSASNQSERLRSLSQVPSWLDAPRPRSAAACPRVLLGAVAAAFAATSVRYGIQDDAWLLHGSGTLDKEKAGRARAARRRSRPLQPALGRRRGETRRARLGRAGHAARRLARAQDRGRRLHRRHAEVGERRPLSDLRAHAGAADFAAFARQAATRYRWVRDWLVWNEPNQVALAAPTTPQVYVTRLLNPAYATIHSVDPRARVAGGVTRSARQSRRRLARRLIRGCVPPARDSTCTRITPIQPVRATHRSRAAAPAWLRDDHDGPYRAADRRGRPRLGWRQAHLAVRVRLPDESADRLAGVSQARHARLLAEAALRAYQAPRVDMLVQYLIRDEPELARFQSGLYTVSGRASRPRRPFRCCCCRPAAAARA